MTRTATWLLFALTAGAVFAPWLTSQDPFDLASIELSDAETPPRWLQGGSSRFPLGADGQGRDVLALTLHGLRLSLAVGALSLLIALAIGLPAGLIAGYFGGWLDAALMRLADIQLSFPALLIALALDGVAASLLPADQRQATTFLVLALAIGLSQWAIFARALRSSTMAQRGLAYVEAARLSGLGDLDIVFRQLLPNAITPLYSLAAIQFASAVLIESTLSFLGVGFPPTAPSLGTLVRTGADFLFSGQWWLVLFPGLALVALALSVNLVGESLRQTRGPEAKSEALQ